MGATDTLHGALTEMVHGRARAPSRQTLRVAANEVRSRVPPADAGRLVFILYAHSISIGVYKEKYFLLMTLDGIDFTFCSATVDRTEPESLIRECVLFIGTQFSILYTSMYSLAEAATLSVDAPHQFMTRASHGTAAVIRN